MARWFGPSLASMLEGFGAPPAKMKSPKGASFFDEAPGVVDLALGCE
jgi:hypothetical protein